MLSCTVGILFDIENVIEVTPATKVHVLFTVSFFLDLFLILFFPIPKIKVQDKESPKLLLGQCACRHNLGKMMARKSLSKSDFEHSYPPC